MLCKLKHLMPLFITVIRKSVIARAHIERARERETKTNNATLDGAEEAKLMRNYCETGTTDRKVLKNERNRARECETDAKCMDFDRTISSTWTKWYNSLWYMNWIELTEMRPKNKHALAQSLYCRCKHIPVVIIIILLLRRVCRHCWKLKWQTNHKISITNMNPNCSQSHAPHTQHQ